MERADRVALVDGRTGASDIERALVRAAFDVWTASDIESLDELLATTTVDCVVSTYQVPRRDGLEFLGGLYALETVAERAPDVPRILYTDIVNQDIAREAVSLGLFDYIPTHTDASLQRLVTRVTDATAKRRAERRVDELSRVNEVIREVLTVLVRATSHERVYDGVTDTLVATEAYDGALFGRRSESDLDRLAVAGTVEESALVRAVAADGSVVTTGASGNGTERRSVALSIDDDRVLVLCTDRPEAFADTEREVLDQLGAAIRYGLDAITTRETLERREATLEEKTERLSTFASVVGHDLRNPLSVASGNLELAKAGETARLDAVESALDRMDELIADVLALAQDGERSISVESVSLRAVTGAAWDAVDTGDAVIDRPDEGRFRADPGQVQRLLENLFRNAVEHGSTGPDSNARQDTIEHGSTNNRTESDDAGADGDTDVRVTVEWTDEGFAVADDGPGLPQSDSDTVFELGVTGSASGTGLGLAIVQRIADAHGWSVTVTESESGGARFEFSGADVD